MTHINCTNNIAATRGLICLATLWVIQTSNFPHKLYNSRLGHISLHKLKLLLGWFVCSMLHISQQNICTHIKVKKQTITTKKKKKKYFHNYLGPDLGVLVASYSQVPFKWLFFFTLIGKKMMKLQMAPNRCLPFWSPLHRLHPTWTTLIQPQLCYALAIITIIAQILPL